MLKDYQGALENLDKANVLEPNNAFTLEIRGDVKKMLHDYHGALEDLHRAHVLEPNNVFILKIHEDVEKMLKGYQVALADLNKVNVLKLDNVFTLNSQIQAPVNLGFVVGCVFYLVGWVLSMFGPLVFFFGGMMVILYYIYTRGGENNNIKLMPMFALVVFCSFGWIISDMFT